jgi:hypothetical protein
MTETSHTALLVQLFREQSLANGFHGMARIAANGEPLQPWEWDRTGFTYVRLDDYEQLAKVARDMAILALQGNDYHRGNADFRDAVDDVLAITKPRNKSDEKDLPR